jgi:hypothetical protein
MELHSNIIFGLEQLWKEHCAFLCCGIDPLQGSDMVCSVVVAWAPAFMAKHVYTALTALQEVTTKTSVQHKHDLCIRD